MAIHSFRFDGSTYLNGDPISPTIGGGKGFAFSFWFYYEADVWDQYFDKILYGQNGSGSQRFYVHTTTSNRLSCFFSDSSGTTIATVTSEVDAMKVNTLHHVCGWIDTTTGVQTAEMYINGELSGTGTPTADALIGSMETWNIGKPSNGMADGACVSEPWFDDNAFDFRIKANREKFRTKYGKAADLGLDGSIPTGSQPSVYLTGEPQNWVNNAGSIIDPLLTGTYARGPEGSAPISVHEKPVIFGADGASDHLQKTAALTGTNSNKTLTFGARFRHYGDSDWQTYIRGRDTNVDRVDIGRSSANNIDIKLYNAAGTQIFRKFGLGQVVADGWVEVLFSVDLATAAEHLYFNGVSKTYTPLTNINDTIDMDGVNEWGFGARDDANSPFWGEFDYFYMTNEYIDLSVVANRAKFIQNAAMIADGVAVTGTAPLIYLRGDASVWNAGTNLGSGGDFDTVNGSVSNAYSTGQNAGSINPLGRTAGSIYQPVIQNLPAVSTVAFDGINDYLLASNLSGQVDTPRISMYFKGSVPTLGSGRYILGFADTGSTEACSLQHRSDGKIRIFWNDTASSDSVQLYSTDTYSDEEIEIHIGMNTNGSVTMYINGVLAGVDATQSGVDYNCNPTYGWGIGASWIGNSRWAGNMDRVTLWNNVCLDVTDPSIRKRMANTADAHLLGNNILDFYGDAATWLALTNHGTGGDFDAEYGTITDYSVTLPKLDEIFIDAVDTLARRDGLVGGDETQYISGYFRYKFDITGPAITHVLLQNTNGTVQLTVNGSSGRVGLNLKDAALGVLVSKETSTTTNIDGKDHEVHWSYDGTTGACQFYIDGVDVKASWGSTATGFVDLAEAEWGIGAAPNLGGDFYGGIYRVAIWKDVTLDVSDVAVRASMSDETLAASLGDNIIDVFGSLANWNAGKNWGTGGDFNNGNGTFVIPVLPTIVPVVFDGTNDYLSRTALIGQADGPLITLYAKIEVGALPVSTIVIFGQANPLSYVQQLTSGKIKVVWYDTTSANVSLLSTSTYENEVVEIFLSMDTDNSATLYINGVSESVDATNSGIDLEMSPSSGWGIGAYASGSGIGFDGSMYRFTIWDDVALDVTDSAVRLDMADPTEASTLGNNIIDMFGSVTDWNDGDNNGVGGYLTMNGAVTAVISLSMDLSDFRLYDDGTEGGSVALQAQNVDATIALETTFQARFGIEATGDPAAQTFTIEYQKDLGSWGDV